jgi:hypothetical protein
VEGGNIIYTLNNKKVTRRRVRGDNMTALVKAARAKAWAAFLVQ